MIRQNNNRASEWLKQERTMRETKQRREKKMKITNKAPPMDLEEFKSDPDLGMKFGLEEPKIKLPTDVEPLYVEKPIGQYEPVHKQGTNIQTRRDEEVRIIRKKWKSEPTTQAELRDCSEELSGESLQKIGAGPHKLDFGNVFVYSQTTQSFIVTNDLRQHIYVKLVIEQDELKRSSPMSQVIPPGQEAGFDITFMSEREKDFRGTVNYFINEVHQFRFSVVANARPVVLDVSNRVLKFSFDDHSTDMSTSKELIIENKGNASAKFKWLFDSNGWYIPTPVEDEVPAGGVRKAKITFTPPGPKPED